MGMQWDTVKKYLNNNTPISPHKSDRMFPTINRIRSGADLLTLPSTAATLQVSHPSRTVSTKATESGWSSIVGISRGSESLEDATDDAIDAEDILKCEKITFNNLYK